MAGLYSVVEEWTVAAKSGFCQVNDTSADTGWWGTALCPPRRTSICSGHTPTAFALGMCPEQMLCRFVCLCWRRGIGVNWRLSGTFNVMIF